MKRTAIATLLSAAALTGAVALPAPAGAATLRQFEGTVVSVDRTARTFRLRDSERGTFTIRVTRTTRYERIAGFSGLRRGLTAIEATVRRSNGRWVAIEVEALGRRRHARGRRLGGSRARPARGAPPS